MSTGPDPQEPRDAAPANSQGPPRGRLVRAVLTLMTGTLLAQAITFGITPLLSRLYRPDDFGVLGLLNAFSMIFVGVAALRFDMAIVVPRRDSEAVNVLLLSTIAVVGTTLVSLLVVAGARAPVARLLGAPGLESWLWLAPVVVFTSGMTSVLNHWCTRNKQFRRISITSVIASAASAAGKGSAFGWGAAGLIVGQIGGQVTATVVLAWQVLRADLTAIRAAADRRAIAAAAREHADFAVYQAPMTFINGFAQNLPVYFFGVYFGPREVGYWSITVMVLSMPVFLVSNAVRQVLFQRTSELYHERGNLSALLRRSTLALAAVGTPAAIAGSLVSPWLFATVLGAEWEPAGELARWVVFWQLTILVGTPATSVFPVLRLQRMVFLWQLVGIVLSGAALTVGTFFHEPAWSVMLYSLTMAGLNVFLTVLVMWRATERTRERATDAPQ